MYDHIKRSIRFDASTLHRVFENPETVLEDIEGFWEREAPLRHAADWHRMVDVPIAWDRFRQGVESIAALNPEERKRHPALATGDVLLRREPEFLSKGLDHLCSYLPKNPATLDIIIYFAGFLRTNAFACGQIVIDVASPYFQDNTLSVEDRASWMLNLLVHECWHGGYCENQEQWTETPPDDEMLYGLLRSLQNEGVATYVNYTAQDVFPSPIDPDLHAIDDLDACRAALASVNDIFSQYGTIPQADFNKLSWEQGVIGRAYYVGGAHMARTIEAAGGRSALTDSIATGPASFVTAYNQCVDAQHRVRVPGM